MMKCKIAHNEGISIFLLVFIIGIGCSYLSSDPLSIQELCSSNRYIYTVREEEPQQLKLTYNSSSVGINKWYQKSKRKCRKEYKTNNGAYHFVIVISNMSIPSCSEKCHCNYFEITEIGNSEKFCGEHKEPIYFETKSDYFSIDFQHGVSMRFEVTLDFTVVRNTYIITGLPTEDPYNSGHFIETPYFPNTYQSDYTSEYIFHTDVEDGHVMLLFLDFKIAVGSYIEVVGHNSTIPARFYGNIFRPPVLLSQNKDLTLKFEANRNPGSSGFRAVSYFLKGSDISKVKPDLNCGGSNYGYGGSVILENQDKHNYDCIWLITTPFFPQSNYFLTVANISLIDVGSKVTLEFREGRNSKSQLVKSIDCANVNCSYIPFEITVSADIGLYIRFTGELNHSSFVGMVYSTYHMGNCSIEESNCEGRCLSPNLVCDGLQHCPDNSDELECTKSTEGATFATVEKKVSTASKAGAAFNVVLSFGIFGLLVVIMALFIFFKGLKTVPLEEEIGPPEVISEMMGPLPRTDSEGSTFDRLPSYDDFIRASDRYPPLLYTRAAKRYSEPFVTLNSMLHTTSFCNKIRVEPQAIQSTIDLSPRRPLETVFANETSISPQPSCSFERSNFDTNEITNKLKQRNAKSGIKRSWSSDSKLDELNANECHLHLSITHCIHGNNCHHCSQKQYYSLPINFKINSWENNDIDIILSKNNSPRIDFTKNRHLSFCRNISYGQSKILTIKTRCHSDPCQFSVHYSLH